MCLAVPIARTGVMEYGQGEIPLEAGPDGIIYVSRDASEVFRKQTMASFEGKPLTINHPDDFVNPDNWKILTKGSMHNVRKAPERDEDGEEVLVADILITDKLAIGLVKAGLRELSCGYEAEYEQTGEGTGRQENIVGNHLALVEQGRAGSSYAIRDHKRKASMKESIMKVLRLVSGGKTIDAAIAEVEKPAVKKEKVKAKATDSERLDALTKALQAMQPGKKKKTADGQAAEVTTFDAEAKDAMQKAYDAIGALLKGQAGDADEEKEKSEDSEEEESEDAPSMDARMTQLEDAVAKLLAGKSEDAEEESESEDAGLEGGEESKDDAADGDGEEKEKKKTGDEAAKKKTGLEGTKKVSTKAVGEKTEDAAKNNGTSFETFDHSKGDMTPELINKFNEARWAKK